ncbi:MAG: zinc ribbon domain-containing protein [Chloroflexota bacterium]
MPNYDFICRSCIKHFEIFISYADYENQRVLCPFCGSYDTVRHISCVKIGHSEESRIDSLLDPEQITRLENDPQALGRMMRNMSRDVGEDLGPEFNDVINRLEKGQKPEDIERDLRSLTDPGLSPKDIGD